MQTYLWKPHPRWERQSQTTQNCIAMKRTHKEEKLLLMGTLEDLAQAEHELAENNDFDDFDEFNY